MDKIYLYAHAGSGNHGCEAIVNSLCGLLGEDFAKKNMVLFTNDLDEDMRYSLKGKLDILEENHMARHFFVHVFYYLYRKITKDRESFVRYRFPEMFNAKKASPRFAISIGGDNYCYPSMVEELMLTNSALNEQGTRTILLGCSVEPSLLEENKAVVEDMKRYELILARESITYQSLLAAGISEEHVRLVPDPAFTMKPREVELPANFIKGHTIGINISPMIEDSEAIPGITRENYRELIKYILESTSDSVALIPHVIWDRNNDMVPLRELYEEFKASGRVCLIEDMSAPKLKYIIGACRIFVGARTHATIAAYSQKVPTLVVGYSVKARGIAKDLFGTEKNYVIPVQSLKEAGDLKEAYINTLLHEDEQRQRLEQVLPDYISRVTDISCEIIDLWEE